jgi:hypothetical protein
MGKFSDVYNKHMLLLIVIAAALQYGGQKPLFETEYLTLANSVITVIGITLFVH